MNTLSFIMTCITCMLLAGIHKFEVCYLLTCKQILIQDVSFGSKVGQIGLKRDEPGTFSDHISPSQNII